MSALIDDTSMAPKMPQGELKPSKHTHTGMWILGFVMIALMLTLVAVAIFFFQDAGSTSTQVTMLQEQVDDLQVDLSNTKEALSAAEGELAVVEAAKLLGFDELIVFDNASVNGYRGVAELQGYYATEERPTALGPDPSAGDEIPTKTCSVFVVTDGPDEAMQYLQNKGMTSIVLGEDDANFDSPWWDTPDIRSSSEKSPVDAVFRFGTVFEGEVVGCMNPYVGFIGTAPNTSS